VPTHTRHHAGDPARHHRPVASTRRTLVAGALAGAAVLATAVPAQAASHGPATARRGAHLSARESSLLSQINAVRRARHLSTVVADGRLASSARAWSATMARAGCIWHDLDRLQRLDDQMQETSLRETLAIVPTDMSRTASVTTRAWLGSAPHRADILAAGMHRAGVGIVASGGDYYITLDIGS
jgi:uncharacterized protein YkwD